MGINLGELEDYVRHVDPVPFAHEVVSFPAPKTTNLQFPNANSREILHHREEHIHEHLPHMFPGMEGRIPDLFLKEEVQCVDRTLCSGKRVISTFGILL